MKLVLSSILVVGACAEPGSEPAPGATPPTDEAELYEWLVEREVPVSDALRVDVDPALLTAEDDDPRYRVGANFGVDASVELAELTLNDLSPTARDVSHGAIRSDDGEGFVWTGVVEASGAAALRLELTDFSLPQDGALYAYNELGDVVGPYTGRGPDGDGHFWTHTLRGDRITLQVRYDGPNAARALPTTHFEIADVGYIDQRFTWALYGRAEQYRSFCSFNASCVENADCSSIPAAIEPAKDAVALMVFSSGRWHYICSGGLIAESNPDNTGAYFLTANHCISKDGEASSLETYFHFQADCGVDTCPDVTTHNTLGSTVLSSSETSDYTLLELDEPAPSGTVALPYDKNAIAHDDGAMLYRISHPQGAPQAYSEHRVDTSKETCRSWPRGDWIYSKDVYGATEGGSSGSPVLNADGEIVGQLSGACGTNTSDNCDAENNATVDGALAAYFDEVAPYLEPGGSCTDADGDGYCTTEGDCDDNDDTVHPGATEVCDDGVDNDCDGEVDEGCSSCTDADGDGWCVEDGDCDDGDDTVHPGASEVCDDGIDNDCDGFVDEGCSCAEKHESCDVDADCCSNKCRGKPGDKSCK